MLKAGVVFSITCANDRIGKQFKKTLNESFVAGVLDKVHPNSKILNWQDKRKGPNEVQFYVAMDIAGGVFNLTSFRRTLETELAAKDSRFLLIEDESGVYAYDHEESPSFKVNIKDHGLTKEEYEKADVTRGDYWTYINRLIIQPEEDGSVTLLFKCAHRQMVITFDMFESLGLIWGKYSDLTILS